MKRHSGYECKRTSLFTGNFTMKMEKKNAKEGEKKKRENSKRRITRDFSLLASSVLMTVF